MLNIRNMHKTYGAVTALKDVSLELEAGKIVALLGANGSGKSTLVKILGGTVKADSGEISMDDIPIKIHSSMSSRKHKISAAYQELSLIPRMTVLENVMLGHFISRHGRIDEEENRRYVEEIFEDFGIKVDLDSYPQDLPPSVQSIVEILKAVSWKPRVLLLDEVTATLHHDEVDKLFAFMRKLAAGGTAIVMVTHRLKEVFEVASRAVILRNGRAVADVNLSKTDMQTIVYHMTGKMPEAQERTYMQNESKDVVLRITDMNIAGKVRKASMVVNRGEIVGIGGLEGQGQSEFLRSIYGVAEGAEGSIELDGQNIIIKDAAAAVRKGIGFISGDRNRESVFGQLTIRENLYAAKMSMGSAAGLIFRNMISNAARGLVDDYGIKIGKITDPISSLSGGNQQKVVFGRWMLVFPKILLMDDPTKGVDVAARRELHNIVKQAADKGMTVILVSSDNDELLELSDRIYVFYEGNIHSVLSGADRTEEKLVTAMMGL